MSDREVTKTGDTKKAAPKIPARIRIGGHTIRVVAVKGLIKEHDAFGTWDDGKLEIQIDAGLNTSLAWETFWHECVEAIVSMTELELAHHKIQTLGLLTHQIFVSVMESIAESK